MRIAITYLLVVGTARLYGSDASAVSLTSLARGASYSSFGDGRGGATAAPAGSEGCPVALLDGWGNGLAPTRSRAGASRRRFDLRVSAAQDLCPCRRLGGPASPCPPSAR
jgi:hypothetical protein